MITSKTLDDEEFIAYLASSEQMQDRYVSANFQLRNLIGEPSSARQNGMGANGGALHYVRYEQGYFRFPADEGWERYEIVQEQKQNPEVAQATHSHYEFLRPQGFVEILEEDLLGAEVAVQTGHSAQNQHTASSIAFPHNLVCTNNPPADVLASLDNKEEKKEEVPKKVTAKRIKKPKSLSKKAKPAKKAKTQTKKQTPPAKKTSPKPAAKTKKPTRKDSKKRS